MNNSVRHSGWGTFKITMCLTAIMMVVLGGAGDFVLCIGEDGHIAFEVAHSDPCGSRGEGSGEGSPPHADQSILKVEYTTCFDIPITVHSTIQHAYHKSLTGDDDGRGRVPASARILDAILDIASGCAGVNGELLQSSQPVRQSLLAHHTTVLLI
jgi:hypothetical protein